VKTDASEASEASEVSEACALRKFREQFSRGHFLTTNAIYFVGLFSSVTPTRRGQSMAVRTAAKQPWREERKSFSLPKAFFLGRRASFIRSGFLSPFHRGLVVVCPTPASKRTPLVLADVAKRREPVTAVAGRLTPANVGRKEIPCRWRWRRRWRSHSRSKLAPFPRPLSR